MTRSFFDIPMAVRLAFAPKPSIARRQGAEVSTQRTYEPPGRGLDLKARAEAPEVFKLQPPFAQPFGDPSVSRLPIESASRDDGTRLRPDDLRVGFESSFSSKTRARRFLVV